MVLRSSKKPAPKFIPYFCALLYIAVVACVIALFAKFAFWLLIVLGVVILTLVLCSQVFSWYSFAELHKRGNKITYEVVEVLDTLGHDRTIYTLSEVTECKLRGKDGFLVGSFIVKEPLRKSKTVKKIRIKDMSNEAFIFIKEEFKL